MNKDYLSLFTESPSSLGINEYKMQFLGEETESEYIKESELNFFSKKRLGIIIGVVIFLIFGGVDYLLFSRLKGIIWFVRFAIVIPLFLMVYSISYIDKLKMYFRKSIPFLVVIMAFAHLMSLRYIPFSATASFYSGYILLIIYSFLLMRSSFIDGVIELSLMAVFYALFVFFNDNIESLDKIIGIILVVCTCFIGLMYTYFAEFSDRKHFILKKKHDFNQDSFDLSDFPFEETIVFVDQDGICKYISKQMENLIPHNKLSIIDSPMSKIFSKKDKKRFEDSVKCGHKKSSLLEENFNVLNKSGVSIPLSMTVTAHTDNNYGDGYIIILSNPELQYSSARLLSNTQQLLREKMESENQKTIGEKLADTKVENNPKSILKETKDSKITKELKEVKNKANKEEVNHSNDIEKNKIKNDDVLKLENDEDVKIYNSENTSKIIELEQRLEELKTTNKSLYRDIEELRKNNTILKDNRLKEINENSLDSIKLMGRMASFVSSNLGKNFSENINYLNENKYIFKNSDSKNYIDIIENRVYQGLYLSGAVAMKFDLFQQYLKEEKNKSKGIEVSASLSNSISQMAKYFKNTNHIVEISCKDNIMVRMNNDSFKYIIQNLIMNSLIAAIQLGKDSFIEIKVREEKAKIIIEYKDNGKVFPSFYQEIIGLKEIDSSVLSVNGVEFFFTKALIERECSGEVSFIKIKDGNKFKMVFMK